MTYKLNVEKKQDYLYFQASGIRTPDSIFSIAKDIRDACKEHGCCIVMIDVRDMKGEINTLDTYEVGSKKINTILDIGCYKISAIDLEENQDRVHFFETVIRNSGGNIRIFSDNNKALEWLIQE